MTTRDDAIAVVVEHISELQAQSDRLATRQQAAATDMRYAFDATGAYRAAADLHGVVASLCEQLTEAIIGANLFDELDAAYAAANPPTTL